jgi:hypothetical protein
MWWPYLATMRAVPTHLANMCSSKHTICWLYLTVSIQIANKLGNLKKKSVEIASYEHHVPFPWCEKLKSAIHSKYVFTHAHLQNYRWLFKGCYFIQRSYVKIWNEIMAVLFKRPMNNVEQYWKLQQVTKRMISSSVLKSHQIYEYNWFTIVFINIITFH